MTLPDTELRVRRDAAASAEAAVLLSGVSKIYRLYDTPRRQLLDQAGLYRLMFWRPPPQFHEFHALKDVDLRIGKGERLGIIGQNGAGKTTLLKLITGNFAASAGTVEVNGTVQALMQLGTGFHQEFSGYENIRSALVYSGLTGRELARAIDEVVDFVELGDFLHQPLKTYSLGMNARLQFAAATAIRPDILIIDEIMGAGDAYFSAKSAVRMRELTASCTLLLVSHSMPQVLQFCSRAVWLEAGRVMMDGPAEEVVGAYEVHSERRIKAAEQRANTMAAETASASSAAPTKGWIANAIVNKELCPSPADAAAYKAQLENGLSVFRWPSNRGAKIRRLDLVHDGQPTTVLHTNQAGAICLSIGIESTGGYRCRYIFSVFNREALRLAWITSPIDHFSAQSGDTRSVQVDLAPVLFGGGTYILSASIFDDVDLLQLSAAHRYDLLARCLEFKVIEHDGRESPVFHHPGDWHFSIDRLEASALSGEVVGLDEHD